MQQKVCVNCIWTKKATQKLSRPSGKYPDYPETFQAIWKLSGPSRKYSDYLEILQTVRTFPVHFQGLRAKTVDVQKLSGWQCHVATMVFGPLLISRSQTYKTCCAVVGSYIFHACIPRPFARSMKIKISICFLEPIAQLHLYLVHVYQSNTALRFCGIMSHRCDIHGTIPGRDCPPIFTRKF